jgi:parallel beta-helix repeat protein
MTAVLTALGASPIQASLIRVPADQPTIQAAINVAANGDVIQVAPGTYIENINFQGKAIRLSSDQGPELTVIDGNHAGPVVTFKSGETPQSVLSGFTVRNGRASVSPGLDGGGIFIQNSSPTIVGSIITNNSAASGGGGISSNFGSPIIQRNLITNNGQTPGFSGGVGGGGVSITGASSAQLLDNRIEGNSWSSSSGGGLTLFAAGTPTVRNNVIDGNTAYSQGGGVWIVNISDVLFVQNTITRNAAGSGGGVYYMVPTGGRGPYFINNTISGNSSAQGSGIYAEGFDGQVQLTNNIIVAAPGQTAVFCGGTWEPTSKPTFQFNDVVSNSGVRYGGICSDQTGVNGNISSDPLFQDEPAGDYHLKAGSPAIDAGTFSQDSLVDPDGYQRPADGNGDGIATFDIGVYEAATLDVTAAVTTATTTPTPNIGGWSKSNTTVLLNASDGDGTGVRSIQYSLSGAQTDSALINGSSASVIISNEGGTTVTYSATDMVGNNEDPKTLLVQVDKSAPIISGMPALGCVLSPAKHQLVQVATVTASDSLSGVAQLTVTAVSSEPDSGTGGGDVAGDVVISGGSVLLRAERSPSGKGRTYTITATASDIAGNVATATATCKVPK